MCHLCFIMESVNNDYIVFKENTFFQNGLPNLEEFRREGKFCDVTLKVDGQSFKAHKNVLAATIPYFHAMFTVDMLESNSSEVTIQGIEAETLKSFLNFVYCGEMKIDTNTVQALLVGASYLQLTQIQDACTEFLIPRLKLSTVLGTSLHPQLADKLNCPTLVKGCKIFIEKNFPAVSLSDEFLDLTADEVKDLLDNDELNVSSEEEVFEALVRWFQRDPLSRKEHLPQLLSKVRFTLMNLDYLWDNVFEQEFIKSSSECRELIDEVKDYFLWLLIRRVLPVRFKTEPRCCLSLGDRLIVIENSVQKGQSMKKMEVYNPLVGKWSSSTPMNGKFSRMAVAVVKNIIYFIGGYNSGVYTTEELNAVQTFDTVTNQWSHISPMQIRRSDAGAGVLKGKLYVCGGYNQQGHVNSVECLDSDIWTYVKSMKYNRSQCAVAALNGYLYAAGGYNSSYMFGHNVNYSLNKVERYDPVTDEWTEVAPMLTKRSKLGMTALNGKLYACGGFNGSTYLETMEMYNPEDNTWQMVAPMNKRRSGLTLIANKGKLWAIGGYDGVSNLSTVEIYDPVLDEWTFGPSMINLKGEVAVVAVPLSS